MSRRDQLKRNFKLMFWIQALTEIRVINVVSTMFLIARGLNLSQIFLLTVVYSVIAVLSEVPSSYLADKWSRKGLITLSIAFGVFYWFLCYFAVGFWSFVVALSVFSISFSFISGTDEALVYDTSVELGQKSGSIKMLGVFYAAPRLFKMFGPIVAVLIASNLSDYQFKILIIIDLVANLIALFLSDYLVEPKHIQKNEKINKGILFDTISLFKTSPTLINITINRTLLFLASFGVWRMMSEYLLGAGTPLLILGLGTTAFQLIIFGINLKTHSWFKNWDSKLVINYCNVLGTIIIGVFFVNELFLHNWLVALIFIELIFIVEGIRGPFFSDLINRETQSYNRATTISGSNLLTELIKLPALLLFSWLIYFGYSYLFGASLVLGLLSITYFSLKS